MMHSALAFGLRWSSDLPLHGFGRTGADEAPADIVVRQAPAGLRPREVVVESGGAALCTDGIRFQAGREVTFDTRGAGLIEWSPGEAWTGALPGVFFGTLTALLLAWRGGIALHGTAVEIGGGAALVCGASGAGKSTLGAGLIALGAKLISDDLSLLTLPETGDAVFLYAGRPATRLFPRITGYLKDADATTRIESFAGEKDFVFPPRVAPLRPIPLTAMIVLGSVCGAVAPAHKAPLLQAQLFRPGWMARIPGHAARSASILHAAHRLHIITMPSLHVRDAETFFTFAAAAEKQMEACRTTLLV